MSAEVATGALTRHAAERLTERIRLTALNYVEARDKLAGLLREAQEGNAHEVLGFASWTAYMAATFADAPMVLAAPERRELVAYLAGEGMSTRAIAPIVGAGHKTVARDIAAAVSHDTPDPARPDEIAALLAMAEPNVTRRRRRPSTEVAS